MEPLGVGLHIIYGRMGAGKTNYAVSEILPATTYKKVVTNIPLYPEYQATMPEIEFTLFKKLEPEKVIRLIDCEHQDTLFIVDEAQMVLMSANKLLVDSFVKKMSQIRQNNQCVVVIAQISKMLPNSIKDLAESCFFFENNNVKGVEKSSKCKRYKTGYDYSSRIIDEFTYIHKYGFYETSNTPITEKPQNLYKRAHIKLFLIFGAAAALFIFAGFKFYNFFSGFDNEQTNTNKVLSNEQTNTNKVVSNEQTNDSLCVRSWVHQEHGIVFYMQNDGQMKYCSITQFSMLPRCPLHTNFVQNK